MSTPTITTPTPDPSSEAATSRDATPGGPQRPTSTAADVSGHIEPTLVHKEGYDTHVRMARWVCAAAAITLQGVLLSLIHI